MNADKNDANAQALQLVQNTVPLLIGLKQAGELVPSLGDGEFLHAGPPLAGWHEACGALRGSVLGTAVHAGLARDLNEAESMAEAGAFRFHSANDYNVLGTFAGVITRHTPLLVVADKTTGRTAGAAINEGRGRALRYGSTAQETLSRLKWLETDFCEMLNAAIGQLGGIDVASVQEQALHMGDDGHSRQKAASALFLNLIAAPLFDARFDTQDAAAAIRFISSNDFFFLPIAIAAAKASLSAAEGVKGSTLVTCMATNGVRFGIKVSGLAGRWFTSQVPDLHGRYFKGFTALDAGPMIGDSVIAETMGLGAFAMAGAPALAPYVGGTYQEATRLAVEMYEITISEHPRYKIPALEYRGTPFGIDAEKVVNKRTTPIFNSGIAHRDPGIGQVGAGYGRAPLVCFERALQVVKAPESTRVH